MNNQTIYIFKPLFEQQLNIPNNSPVGWAQPTLIDRPGVNGGLCPSYEM